MSSVRPSFFEPIRKAAQERWLRLESDPDIAGPWRLLFKQVQSPRHVLSELMQNADDVGAKNAVVSLENDVFSFMHDGEDFSEAHFQSICRFGYSNKREMHTIGFRGIGFKSVFSLGDRVFLLTPTLSVYFDSARFTLPVWTDAVPRKRGWTEIRIEIKDNLRKQDFEANIREWTQTGVSLLFFRNIRSFRVGNLGVQWQVKGAGPATGTEWMTKGGSERNLLYARSNLLPFPPECLDEIRMERQVFESDTIETAPCSVEIVPGAKGRLFVILPTGVETNIPFACNAPFVQDPARLKIKELEICPTNRWLLERIGQLAADVILSWVSNTSLPAKNRTNAYLLLFQPSAQKEESSTQISDRVERVVATAMANCMAGKQFLIDSEENLCAPGLVYAVDPEIQQIWSTQEILTLMSATQGTLLHPSVPKSSRDILIAMGHVLAVNRSQVFQWLRLQPVPKPISWEKLAMLWAYLAPELMLPVQRIDVKSLAIVPTTGEWLVKPTEVVRPRPGVVLSADESELLAKFIKLFNEDWISYLDPNSKAMVDVYDIEAIKARTFAMDVYERLGSIPQLSKQSITEKLASLASKDPYYNLDQCAVLVRMAVETDATIPKDFRYYAQNGRSQLALGIAYDPSGFLDEVMPEEWKSQFILHNSIVACIDSTNFKAWSAWLASPKSGISQFPRPQELLPPVIKGRDKIIAWLKERDGDTDLPNHRSQEYRITDYGYDTLVLDHWKTLPSQQLAKVFSKILEHHSVFLDSKKDAMVESLVRIGKWAQVALGEAFWLKFFRKVPCLLDSNGVAAKPSELTWTAQFDAAVTEKKQIHVSYGKYTSVIKALGVREAVASTNKQLAGNLDRFAQSNGFEQDPVRLLVFTHPNGKTITNCGTAPFSWHMLDSKGTVMQQIQVLDAIDDKGIVLSLEEWEQFKNGQPERAYLLTHPVSGEPQLMRYKDFYTLLRTGEWTLEYTGYRLMRKKNT